MVSQRWLIMANVKGVIHYQLAMNIFRKWFDEKVITSNDFARIEALIAAKYDLSEFSIYRKKA